MPRLSRRAADRLSGAVAATLLIVAVAAEAAPLWLAPEAGKHCFTTNAYEYAEANQATHLRRGAFMATITRTADPSVDEWEVCGHYSGGGR